MQKQKSKTIEKSEINTLKRNQAIIIKLLEAIFERLKSNPHFFGPEIKETMKKKVDELHVA